MFDYDYIPQLEGPPCVVCGLPQTRNPHPEAGKPSHLNIVGAMWGCLPCAERRANGRHRLIADLGRWLNHETKEGTCPEFLAAIRKVREKLAELDEARRVAFHAQK
jgi:hypothetical protein